MVENVSMTPPEQPSQWTANIPAVWPHPPTEMSVTTLAEIEACPRRWALNNAAYPAVWNGRGYPPQVQLSTLKGTVVHLTLEAITKGLVRAGCPSVQDPVTLQVMRDLGGYTKVVNDCIDRVHVRLASSPRASRILEFVVRSLRAQVPDLRMRAQTMLCRMRLPEAAVSSASGYSSVLRRPLTQGVFPEIELRAKQIGWKGKADLLVLSPDACEITDFKTGGQDDEHRFQIKVYALLWRRDNELNPGQRCADRLILRYSSGDVAVAVPTESELDELEKHIVARSNAAHEALSQQPPEVRPAPDHCRYCGVRQLCNEYWTVDAQRRMAQETGDWRFGDIAVTITSRHGPSSWDAKVETSSIAKRGQSILLRADNLPFGLQAGQKLRLLSVILSALDNQAPEAEPPIMVATMGAGSEAFIISP